MDYIMADERLPGWEASFSSHSWFKKDNTGITWQAYDNGFDAEMQFRTISGRRLGLNSPMTRNHFEGLFHD